MADLISRVIGPTAIGSGTSTLHTGTAGHVYTLKTMRIENPSGGSVTVKLGIGGVADANLILAPVTLDAGEHAICDDILVLSGTETLQANASATGLTFTASGLDQT